MLAHVNVDSEKLGSAVFAVVFLAIGFFAGIGAVLVLVPGIDAIEGSRTGLLSAGSLIPIGISLFGVVFTGMSARASGRSATAASDSAATARTSLDLSVVPAIHVKTLKPRSLPLRVAAKSLRNLGTRRLVVMSVTARFLEDSVEKHCVVLGPRDGTVALEPGEARSIEFGPTAKSEDFDGTLSVLEFELRYASGSAEPWFARFRLRGPNWNYEGVDQEGPT